MGVFCISDILGWDTFSELLVAMEEGSICARDPSGEESSLYWPNIIDFVCLMICKYVNLGKVIQFIPWFVFALMALDVEDLSRYGKVLEHSLNCLKDIKVWA